MRRVLLMAAALAIPVSGLSIVALNGGVAGAASKISCTSINGTVTGTITISGCTGGNTGGSSKPTPTSTLASGGTIDWVSGSTTTFNQPTLKTVSAKKCPGYVKKGSNNPTAESASGTVTADTGDGIKVPGKFKGKVCVSPSGTITAYPGKPLTAT
jgi:hypothetical protein